MARQKNKHKNSKKKYYLQLLVIVLVSAILAYITIGLVQELHRNVNDELPGWLNLSGAGIVSGVSAIAALAIVIGADLLWFIFCILWLIKRKLHIKDKDKALYVP
jgi:hypothetical protein